MSLDQAMPINKQSAVLIGNESLLVECAKLWLGAGHEIAMIVTRNPAIADWARSDSLAVEVHDGDLTSVDLPIGFDWLLSIANLQILPAAMLDRPSKGAVNFHDGPLPAYAGLNAPIWARINGETSHGVTWHLIENGVDEGDILVQRRFQITERDTALTLNTKCFEAAMESFPQVISALSAETLPRVAQDLSGRSYFGLSQRPPAGGQLDFNASVADTIALVRALDHGGYFNPLTTAKIRLGGALIAVSTADEVAQTGKAGEVLAVDETALTVAFADGALRLSGLTDLAGQPISDLSTVSVGEILPLAENGEATQQALSKLARHEGDWRGILAKFAPMSLPLITGATAPADWRVQSVDCPDGLSSVQIIAGALIFAARSGVEEGTGLALSHAAQTRASDHLSDWVPLAVDVAADQSVQAFVQAVDTQVTLLKSKDSFARDLIARVPALQGIEPPDLAIIEGTDPIASAALNIVLEDSGLQLTFDATRVPADHAEHLAERLELALKAVARNEGTLADIDILPERERAELLTGWLGADVSFDPASTVHGLVQDRAQKAPDATALVFEHQSITYAGLNARANQVARRLLAQGVSSGDIVGVHCRRSLDLVVACLAIMKTGAAYLPLDPSFPADRIALYLEDSAAKFVISQSGLSDELPTSDAEIMLIDSDPAIDGEAVSDFGDPASGKDLAYVIFTSGSTGRPKGVMVEHSNVVNFFLGMDDRVKTDGPATWLAVTSLSFDISVLELFYTLSRGHKVVLSGDESATQISDGSIGRDGQGMDFSLYYWGNDDGAGRGKYRLLLEGAQFADENGFCAVWTPERHFHAFGGPYPNPSVTGAAVAGATKNIGVRAGSCVAPLHHTARIAEEWAVIDNLTNGKAGLAIASGWQPDDFVLRPENTPPANKEAMFQQIADLRKLWRGEAVEFPRQDGTPHAVVTQPRPVSKEPEIWVTTAGNPETWKEAGRNGAHILTHLLGQSIDEVADKIKLYHAALKDAGHDPADYKVTMMLHSFVGDDRETVRDIARAPMKNYLRSAAGLIKQYAWAFPAFKKPEGVTNPFELDLGSLNEEEMDGILEFAFLRYFEDSGLFGTVEDCKARTEELKRIGVTEIACLIDYGIDTDVVLAGLRPLAKVAQSFSGGKSVQDDDVSIAGQIIRHDVTHLQCTPSMARLLTMNEEAATALGQVAHLYLGGEALPGALVAELNALTGAEITNMYGPTETTIWSSTASPDAKETTANIGYPIANTQLYVVDEDLNPVPFGVPGELLIGGAGVTRGYWQRDDLTEDRFVADPFAGSGRLYRTGDLVRRRLDGALEFVGRADHQVKLRGYRIELGEIESRLESLPNVRQAVAVTREDVPGDVRLVAYVIGSATEAEMRSVLTAHLPAYMVPSHFVDLKTLPLTPNKKIDRKALPAPAKPALKPAETAAEEPLEISGNDQGGDAAIAAQIAALWTSILGVQNIAPQDNFFDLGGHSLLAVQAHREIRDRLGYKGLSITDIFRFPTLAGLSGRIEALAGPVVPKRVAPISPAAEAAPSNLTNEPTTPRQNAMAKRRAMRARRRERLT